MSDSSSVPSRAISPANEPPLGTTQTVRPFRFTWDPSARKLGPGSVSEATEARGDHVTNTRPRPDVLGAAPATLPVGSLPTEWSSSKHGFHAISTVLNNPHKRQAPPKAHSALPAVPPTELPRVRRKDFDPYLRAISAEWDRFEKNRQLGQQGVAQLDDDPATPRASLSTERPTSPPASRVVSSAKSMPSLATVPTIFFESSFDLGDPQTFRTVTEQDAVEDDAADPSALSYSLPLLEKMSHYADTVEQHLVREISLRSTSFFAALANLHDLQSESEQCLDRIAKLRGLLKDVDAQSAKRGLEVIRMESKLRNLNRVRESVKMVGGVVEMTGVAKSLVSAGQWGEALGVIEEIEGLCSSEAELKSAQNTITLPSPMTPARSGPFSPLPPLPEAEEHRTKPRKPPLPVPLSSLHAFASLPDHLRALTMEITSSLSLEVVNVLRVDLLERMNGHDRSPSSPHPDINQSLKDRLRPLLHGLVRTKGVREAMLSWREVVMGEVQNVVKQHLPFFGVSDEGSRSSSIPDTSVALNQLRNVSHTEFMALLQPIYKVYLNGVTGLQSQGGIIIEIFQTMPTPHPSLDISALQEELNDILSSAAELSNTRAAKLLSARSEQNAALELPDFLAFFNESWNFVVNCEVICRRMIVGLRGVVISQAKAFLQVFHQSRISRSAKLVEDEQWGPCEVTPSMQHLADVLVEAAVRDPEELIIVISATAYVEESASLDSSVMAPPSSLALPSPSEGPAKPNGPSASSRHLRIEGKPYHVVSATSDCLALLIDYLRVIMNLSTLTMDTMSRVIEFLKAFNSRTCQVVLGAGAMRSAGLKNITAKHLALASQSLSIMISLIPYVRETFRRHLSATQAVILVEFDKLKRDYQEHQNEIHAKLIAIMGDRLTAHIKTLQAVDWNAPKQGINDYMEILVKETVTLHKVLSRYLSTIILEDVMTQVFAAINHRLSEEYGKIELPTLEAKARLLADAKYLHQKLSTLKNVSTPSGMLETVVTEKTIARKDAVPPQSPPAVEPPKGSTNVFQRGKSFVSFKSPVDKALPTPAAEGASATTINGMGRKSDINGRINARLSSLMSPLASSAAAVPGEEEGLTDRDRKTTVDDISNALPERPNEKAEMMANAAAATMREQSPDGAVVGSPRHGDGVDETDSREVVRVSSPSASLLVSPPLSGSHQVDMTKPVMRSGPET